MVYLKKSEIVQIYLPLKMIIKERLFTFHLAKTFKVTIRENHCNNKNTMFCIEFSRLLAQEDSIELLRKITFCVSQGSKQ
jgi:hypothetical protein